VPHDLHEPIDEFHDRLFTLTPAARGTTALLAVNIAIYVAMVLRGENGFWGDARSLVAWGANFGPATRSEWWRLLAAPFLHGGVLHLALNMIALESGGPLLERSLGTARFLAVYVLSAIAASVGSVLVHPQLVSVGASGAVFGIFGALLGIALHHAPPADRWSYLRPSFGRPELPDRAAASPVTMSAGLMPPELSRLLATQIVGLVILNALIGLAVPVIDNAAHGIGFLAGLGLGWLLAGVVSMRVGSVPRAGAPAGRIVPDRSRWVVPTAAVLFVALGSNAIFPLLPLRARLTILDTGCGLGAGGACLAAAREVRLISGGRDSPAARDYMERGCRAGSGASCTALGLTLVGPAGGAAAARPLAMACELGDAEGCRLWGMLLDAGQGVPRDVPRAMVAYERGCDGRDAFACLRLANAVHQGRGIARDPKRAAALALESCDLGEPRGCTLRGMQLVAGNDMSGGIRQFERACSAGESIACTELGELFETGRGVPRDVARAANSYYAPACARGMAVACTRAGRLFERQQELLDPARAVGMYEAGCRLGQGPSCFSAGAMYAEGRGRPRDAAKALAFYEQACARGLKQVCALVAQLRESASTPH
jgi:TPR repeat protein/membrane associated rhomboid family serine protease